MPVPMNILSAVTRPGSVIFTENRESVQALTRGTESLIASPHPSGTVWHLPTALPTNGPRVLVTATGHGIVYGEHGRRILYVDPGGTPLHECAWSTQTQGPPTLIHARFYLDWGQWVGLKPEGLVNEASFDISRKPGWQKLTPRDLQTMAAQALHVTPEEIAFFYDDKSLTLDSQGRVTIRHRKDAFYILEDGTFSRPRFMACMGAMHWGQIDFLPVVELFQSLLAGTGSATFELIRGLYDDQTAGGPPRLLRYRGIPTYPSPQAFQLNWLSINGGGAINASSTNYQLGLSVGQSVAGFATSSSYQMGIGFWYGAASGAPACGAAKGDLNGVGGLSPADAILMLNCAFLLNGAGTVGGDCNLCYTDMNCVGGLTPADVIIEMNYVFLAIAPPC